MPQILYKVDDVYTLVESRNQPCAAYPHRTKLDFFLVILCVLLIFMTGKTSFYDDGAEPVASYDCSRLMLPDISHGHSLALMGFTRLLSEMVVKID